ncbi:hypothetical protein WN55_10770 [Dufourea novaeangliae]|uniref:Uncharacterized protein n=1 Tax=Dufourea novaeangliae TaxID=178035 RepID=A0A154PA98_DUFNO|nr:hypothetical protein WN55_10770 [Dufourea novaeangliae]
MEYTGGENDLYFVVAREQSETVLVRVNRRFVEETISRLSGKLGIFCSNPRPFLGSQKSKKEKRKEDEKEVPRGEALKSQMLRNNCFTFHDILEHEGKWSVNDNVNKKKKRIEIGERWEDKPIREWRVAKRQATRFQQKL